MRLSILAHASAFPLLFASQLVSAQTFNPDEVIVPEPMVAELNEESSSQADIDLPVEQIDELPEPMMVKGQLGASFTTGEGMGYESSFGSLSGFVPFLQDPGNSLWYFNGRMNLDTENGDFGSNSVIGYRQYSPAADIVFGGYVGFDTKNTVNDSIFSQIGLGFEALGNPWEFRANGYIPVGDRRSLIFDTLTGAVPSFAFQGHFLGYTAGGVQIFEESLIGLDLEAGTRLFDWGSGNLRGYIGTYLYDTPSGSGFIGLSGRLLAQVSDNFNAGVSLTTDNEFGTNLTFTVSADIGGAPKAKAGQSETESVVARLGDALNRQTNVAVRQVEESTFVSGFVTNPETSDPWYFVHVSPGGNSDGSFEDPFGTMDEAIAAAPPQSIIYVDDFVETPGDFTLPATIQLLSRGPSQFIDTVEFGTLQIPLSGNGNFPLIAGTVTLSGDNVLSGFTITPPTGQAAVVANGGSNFSIRYNTITDLVLEGSDNVAAIDLTNVSGEIEILSNEISNVDIDGIYIEVAPASEATVTILENIIDTTGEHGIHLDGYESTAITATITGNQLSNIGSDGILVENTYVETSNVTITDNTVETAGGNGIVLYNYDSGAITATITGNQLSNIASDGIFVGNAYVDTSNVTIADNTIETAGEHGIHIDSYDSGASTAIITGNQLSNTGSDGILVENKYIDTSNVTIADNTIDSTGGNGIVLDNYDLETITATITGNQLSNIEGDDNSALNVILNEIFNVNPEGILPARAGIIVDNKYIGTSNITVANNEISTSAGAETEKYSTAIGIYNIEVDNAIVSVSGNTASAGSIRIGNYNVPDATTTIEANTITDGNIGFLEGSIETDRLSTVTIANNQVDAAESKYAIAKVSLGKYGEVTGNTTISGNTVSNAYIGIGYLSAGFDQAATSNVTISGNTVSNAGIGVGHLSVGLNQTATSNVTISDNNISDVDGGVKYASLGKYQTANSNVTISGNNISNAKYGIDLLQGLLGDSSSRSLSATISENTIANVDDGIRFDQFLDGASGTQEAILTIDGNTIQNVGYYTLDLSQNDNSTSGNQSLCAVSISGNSFDTGADIIFDNLNGATPGGAFNVVDLTALEADSNLNISKDGTITNNPACKSAT